MAGIAEVKGIEKYQNILNENKTDTQKKSSEYGRTVGNPELSDTAKKYYDELKKKYGNYDFILVSKDEKENAKANAAKYANGYKTVVLIGEEEIEKMATDESFRRKYENLLDGAAAQLEKLKASMESSGANVAGYGVQVNENGTLSYFAVLKKSSIEQRVRTEKRIEANREARKEANKKAEKERLEARAEKRAEDKERLDETSDEDDVIISASSVEELLQKIGDYTFTERSNSIQTESEKMIGQNIDFRG